MTFRLPATIYLAKESDAIYSGSAYTRCSAVFLPAPQPAAVLIHELYHVMSRNNPQIRRELYALVGYRPCRVSRSSLGADLKDIVITNPDTDAFGETCITLPDAAGRPVTYLPLLIGNAPYDGTPPGWTIILDPILVALHGNRPVVRNGKTEYREMISPDYMRAVGERQQRAVPSRRAHRPQPSTGAATERGRVARLPQRAAPRAVKAKFASL